MPRKRCENCAEWASTDRVWGECTYASTRDENGQKIAHASYVRVGNEHQAELETKFNFGCAVWRTNRAAA